jgi:hypothetical protein
VPDDRGRRQRLDGQRVVSQVVGVREGLAGEAHRPQVAVVGPPRLRVEKREQAGVAEPAQHDAAQLTRRVRRRASPQRGVVGTPAGHPGGEIGVPGLEEGQRQHGRVQAGQVRAVHRGECHQITSSALVCGAVTARTRVCSTKYANDA